MNFTPLHGDTLAAATLAGLTLTETAYTPNLKLPKHSHKEPYFCFVLRGRFTEHLNSQSRDCVPSTVVFHPAGETHADHFHTPARCFNIQLNKSWLSRMPSYSPMVNMRSEFYAGSVNRLAARVYGEFLEPDPFSAITIEGLMLEIIADLCRSFARRNCGSEPLWLKKIRKTLQEEFCERPSLVALAESVSVHPGHLAREFRRFYHCTIGEYIRQRRLEFACHELSSSRRSISNIALAAGFFDHSHFNRTFKNHTGLTPRQFRKTVGIR